VSTPFLKLASIFPCSSCVRRCRRCASGRQPQWDRCHGDGYGNWSKAKSKLDAIVGLKEPWTLHDLRRTVRTGLGMLGIAPHIAEAVLNHLPAKLIRTYDPPPDDGTQLC
jgi:hypothetical protein